MSVYYYYIVTRWRTLSKCIVSFLSVSSSVRGNEKIIAVSMTLTIKLIELFSFLVNSAENKAKMRREQLRAKAEVCGLLYIKHVYQYGSIWSCIVFTSIYFF